MARLVDQRNLPIFIHSTIDDMTNLSPNAMRVYMHLARRADRAGVAWPSYQSIGDHCFVSVSQNPVTRRSMARKAVDELIASGLISKTNRADETGNTSNAYTLHNPVPIDTAMPIGTAMPHNTPPVPNRHSPVPIGTKDTPVEDTPIEDTPKGEGGTEVPTPLAPSNHPAIKAYRELHGRYPETAQMVIIAERDPPLAEWVRALRAWAAAGFKRTNIEGILDWTFNPSLIDQRRSSRSNGANHGSSTKRSEPDSGDDTPRPDPELQRQYAERKRARATPAA